MTWMLAALFSILSDPSTALQAVVESSRLRRHLRGLQGHHFRGIDSHSRLLLSDPAPSAILMASFTGSYRVFRVIYELLKFLLLYFAGIEEGSLL